jgi:branched-chain amino acid transport system ATP-binding protein
MKLHNLQVKSVSVSFGGVQAVRNVSFTVEPGRIVGLIGPNGAGKSSLLNCISGLSRPDTGSVMFGSKELVGLRPDQIAECGLGRVFQHPEVIGEMSVLDNLLVACHRKLQFSVLSEMLGLPSVRQAELKAREEVEKVAQLVGLHESLQMNVASLPYGHRKLLELGRVILLGSKLLLLDEPIAGLNESEIEQLAQLIMNLRSNGNLSILLVEHNMGLVRQLCDEAVVLDAGQVIAQGTPEQVLNDPKVLLAYMGEVVENA